MHDDGEEAAESAAAEVPTVDMDTALAIADDVLAPAPFSPETLVQALRLLQERIPGFDQMSVEEARSLLRVATLDPEFIAAGIEAACAMHDAKSILRYSGEEMREISERAARYDELQREFQRMADGVGAASLKLKHQLGRTSLLLYTVLRQSLREPNSPRRHLRPHYEAMQRAYMKKRKTRRKPGKE
jgi:hypothetical protein